MMKTASVQCDVPLLRRNKTMWHDNRPAFADFASRLWIALSLLFGLATAQAATEIVGAGDAQAESVFRAWAAEIWRAEPVKLSYQSLQWPVTLERLAAAEIDFSVTSTAPDDMTLKNAGMILVPIMIGGTVPVINLPNHHGPLHLDAATLARIVLRKITRWNAPELIRLNPGASLPDLPIVLFGRSDPAGATYALSDFLSQASASWKHDMGVAPTLHWRDGTILVQGATAMASAVEDTPGSIGYVDYQDLNLRNLTGVLLANASGHFVAASPEAFRAALRSSDWYTAGDLHATLANRTDSSAWPMTTARFVVMPQVARNPARARTTIRFFVWALLHGDDLVSAMNFVRLPDPIQAIAFRNLASIVDQQGTPLGLNTLDHVSLR